MCITPFNNKEVVVVTTHWPLAALGRPSDCWCRLLRYFCVGGDATDQEGGGGGCNAGEPEDQDIPGGSGPSSHRVAVEVGRIFGPVGQQSGLVEVLSSLMINALFHNDCKHV